jgi:hypothetical protein
VSVTTSEDLESDANFNNFLEKLRKVYFTKKKDFDVGKTYIEIVDRFVKSRAVVNRDVALMLSQLLLDNGKFQNAEW